MSFENLKKEFEFYLAHQGDLVEKYNGRVIVIKNETVIGNYESEFEAVAETQKTHAPGSFLVQKCSPGTDDYTQIFHSRVAFV